MTPPPPSRRPAGVPTSRTWAEEIAVPGDDFTEPYADALEETEETEEERTAERRR